MIARLCSIFLLSGAAALLFETVWFRLAGLTFGNGVWASSIVLASFMAGLGLGNALVARFGHRVANPILAYAKIEVVLALAGVGLVFVFPMLNDVLAPLFRAVEGTPALMNGLRLAVAFVLLLLPTAAMGATLPVLVKGLVAWEPRFGRTLGLLYGFNTLGAVFGAFIGEVALIERLGVRGTGLLAGGCDLLVALAAWAISREYVARVPAAADTSEALRFPWPTPRAWRLLAGAFLAGGSLLALEVVWFRYLSLWTFGTALAFSLMLAIVLAGIGTGGIVASALLGRRDGAPWITVLALASATLVLVTYGIPAAATETTRNLWDLGRLARDGFGLMFPVSFLSGILFPTIGQRLEREIPSPTAAAGWLTLANTTGAMLGALAGGFLLLPKLGVDGSVVVASVALLGVALVCLERPVARVTRIGGVALGALWIVAVAMFPHDAMETRVIPLVTKFFTGQERRIVEIREGLTETITYMERTLLGRPYRHRLVTNGYSMSGSNHAARRYMRLYVYLPNALRPDPKTALLVSFGVGNTAKALTETKSLERIDIVDISRDILEMNRIVYPDPAEAPLEDPRVHVHIEDGRQYLQRTDRLYDLITSEPPPPKQAGVVNLYSKEYFELARDHLAPRGLVSYWVPMHALASGDFRGIVHAFCDVFAECSLWLGAGPDWMLLGSREPHERVPDAVLARQWDDPDLGPEMRAIGLESPDMLGALFIADGDTLRAFTADTPPVVDDHPHRISPYPPAQLDPYYHPMLEIEPAVERFLLSAQMSRLFSDEQKARMLPWFEWRTITHDILTPASDNTPFDRYAALHEVLTRSELHTLVLWLLKSDAKAQEIVDAVRDEKADDPVLHSHLGHRALADRAYAAAAEHYAKAHDVENVHADLLELYALCLDGRRELAKQRYAALPRDADPPIARTRLRALIEDHCLAAPETPTEEAPVGADVSRPAPEAPSGIGHPPSDASASAP